MKYLYKCEICGKTFEDSDEAYRCERSHRAAEVVSTYGLDKATRDLCYDGEFFVQHYAPGEDIPDRVWMKLPKVDEDGTYIRDEHDVIQYEAVCYTIDRKSINSTVACTLSRSINLGQLEALERYNAYEAERAAKREQEGETMNERTYRDRARIVKCMNYLVVSMNNKNAYYAYWINTVPDGADDEDFADIARDDDLYAEVCNLFRELMGLLGADGFYASMDEKAF